MRTCAGGFDLVIWRSLLNAPPLGELLKEWLRILSQPQLAHIPERLDEQLRLLFDYLRQRRCLPLVGLDVATGNQLLSARGLRGPAGSTATLVQRYSGNPLVLKLLRHPGGSYLFQDEGLSLNRHTETTSVIMKGYTIRIKKEPPRVSKRPARAPWAPDAWASGAIFPSVFMKGYTHNHENFTAQHAKSAKACFVFLGALRGLGGELIFRTAPMPIWGHNKP